MARDFAQSGAEGSGARFVLRVNHPTTAKADTTTRDLYACVLFDLDPHEGVFGYLIPSQRFLGDLAVTFRQITPTDGWHTRFKATKTAFLRTGGSNGVESLGDLVVPILVGAIQYLIKTFAPPLSILVNALWKVFGERDRVEEGTEALELQFFKWWSFIKWHTRPGSVYLELEVALKPDMETTGSYGGKTQYQVDAGAKLGPPLRFRTIGTGSVDPIAAGVPYTIDWESS